MNIVFLEARESTFVLETMHRPQTLLLKHVAWGICDWRCSVRSTYSAFNSLFELILFAGSFSRSIARLLDLMTCHQKETCC